MVRLILDRDIKEWRVALPEEKSDITISEYIIQKLDNILKLQKKNWDSCFIIVGRERSGKSTLSFICGQYLTRMGLTMDNICNTSEEALEKIKRLPNGSVIILDEAHLMFSSRETMTREQRQLTKVMMIMGQKNMTLILVSPVFFDLAKYIAVDRSNFLIRVYRTPQLSRGNFAYWGEKRKAKLYHEGKKAHGSYLKPKPNFYGSYSDYILPFDSDYQLAKQKALEFAINNDGKRKKKLVETPETLENEEILD